MLSHTNLVIPAGAADALSELGRYLSSAPLLVVISGPSGVGKDSVIKRMRELGHSFHFVVTATDRPPRPGEVDGLDYHFLSAAEFERMTAADEFLEHAQVYGQHKGVPKVHARQALASGQDVIMRLDVQGAATVRDKAPGAVTIFIAPPSLEALVSRLRRRPGDSADQLRERLDSALSEMGLISAFDYVVINRENLLDEAVADIAAIMQAERLRVGRPEVIL